LKGQASVVDTITDHVGYITVAEPEEGQGLPAGEKLFDVRDINVSSNARSEECAKPLVEHRRYEVRRPDGTVTAHN